mgnify:CR=1 FL=1
MPQFIIISVGHYTSEKASKKDNEKLLKLGLKPYIFMYHGSYTLRVGTVLSDDKAVQTVEMLCNRGFDAFAIYPNNPS